MSDEKYEQLEELGRLVTEEPGVVSSNDYFRRYDLIGNPFPPSGIADASGDNTPLADDVFSTILNFIRRVYTSRNGDMLVIRGDYGTGKTHTLRFIERTVNTRMNKGERAARAIFVERPRIDPQELNRTVLASLGFDTVKKYSWFVIYLVFVEELRQGSPELTNLKKSLVTAKLKPRNARTSAMQPLWSDEAMSKLTPFDQVFNAETILDYREFFEALENAGWQREEVRGYLTHLLLRSLGQDSSVSLAQAFVTLLLAGDDATYSTWETLVGVPQSKALSSVRVVTFLKFLLRIMELNGIAYVFLLLDEFEEVSQGHLLGPRQRQDYLYTIREILNSVQTGLSTIIAISPPGWDALVTIATPLADVNRQAIVLGPIDLEKLTRLVQHYMGKSRSADTSPESKQRLAPLSEVVLAYILDHLPKAVQPTPRNLVQLLHNLFAYAADNDLEEFTPEIVDAVLEQYATAKAGRLNQPKTRRRPNGVSE